MNYGFVVRQLGTLLLVLSACMLGVMLWDVARWPEPGTPEWVGIRALGLSVAVGAIFGGTLWVAGGRGSLDTLGRREALLLVSASWLLGAALAGLPYHLWAVMGGPPAASSADHPFQSPVACYFEAMSGLTTTGATVLSAIRELPQGLLLWRALTHWLGGLGIVVLFVAVLPNLGVRGKRLFQVESTVSPQQGVRPRIRETARVLWLIYLVLTLASVVLLRLTGAMGWFDAVCHSFSVISTGGLSTRDASIGHYDSVAVDVITIVFMLLAGMNFVLFYHLTRGRWAVVWRDVELRVYLVLKVVVAVVVAANLWGTTITTTAGQAVSADAAQALRYGAFQTVALQTGTGYTTADYDLWPMLSKVLLVGLFFVGGCAGSTAGGIKVIRLIVAGKLIRGAIERAYRPAVVRPVRVGGSAVEPSVALGAAVFVLVYLALVGAGAGVLLVVEGTGGRCDAVTAVTASLSTLSNIGPGLHAVGATQNYGWFSGSSLGVMSLLMVLGRLEVFAILVLLSPSFWRTT